MPNYLYLFLFCFAYILGALPVGYWYALFFYKIDITKYGSETIGATNCARILGGFKHFFIIFSLDTLKSYLTLNLIKYYQPEQWFFLTASGILLIGNGYSIFLNGRGGKGVSTYIGILLALNPLLACCFFSSWLFIKSVSKSNAGASIAASLCIPFCSFYFYGTAEKNILFFLIAAGLWVLYRHKKNISLFLYTL